MAIFGIDVSAWQGKIDWEKVAKAGVEFAMLKAGGADDGYYEDSRFKYNYEQCKKLGIPVGAYYFTGKNCITASQGRVEAQKFLAIIKGCQFEYPVAIDVEAQRASKSAITTAVIAFCEEMENNGYYVSVYGSTVAGFKNRMETSRLTAYDKWVADYRGACYYTGDYGIWQFSSKQKISGINGNVDGDYCYMDYPTIIKNAKLNGFTDGSSKKEDKKEETKTEEVYYKIQKGDTLSAIAKKYGTTAKKIQKLNPDKIKDVNLIYAGDTIRVK